jgi:pimeloyl-ACP methyl ester carboxylesterase
MTFVSASRYVARATAFILIALAFTRGDAAHAQADRYELGRRLRALETDWDAFDSAESRRRALGPLKQAVAHFFSFKIPDAGKALGEARLMLASEKPSIQQRFADALVVKPQTRLVDTRTTELPVALEAFYPIEVEAPKDVRWRLSLIARNGDDFGPPLETPITTLPCEVKLPLKELADGDHVLRSDFVQGNTLLLRTEVGVSASGHFADRIKALRPKIEEWPEKPTTTERESAKAQLKIVEALAEKRVFETDYPGSRLLIELEMLVPSATMERPYYANVGPAEFWITLAADGKTAPVRVRVPPEAANGDPRPLVIAMHGAGGSENMFFDGYGNGAVVRLALERGWLVVAPRAGGFSSKPLAAVVDELARILPVDTKQVFVVGHSMGAAQAIAAAQQTPDRFQALAALGGGGVVREGSKIDGLPFFVGVGSEDFALKGARSLAEALKKKGNAQRVELKEYPDIEHLAIVQVALKDVFAFFDSVAKKP